MVLVIKKISKYSWFKIITEEKTIHIDPGYAGYIKNQKIAIDELHPKADFIFITHFHKDHLQPEALSEIRKSNTIIMAPEKCSNRVQGDFQVTKPGDKFKISDIEVKVVDAYNIPESSSTRKFHHKGDGVGYLITIDGHIIYHAGDTDLIPEMQKLGVVEVALLPIGGIFTMNVDEAVEAALTINPRIIIPMHIRDADPENFKVKVEKKSDTKVIKLDSGESYSLK